MDIQLLGSSIGMAWYITTYFCKAETGNLPEGSSHYRRLFKLGSVLFSHRQISIQEALLILSDHKMKHSSWTVQFIDTHQPNLHVHISQPQSARKSHKTNQSDNQDADIEDDLFLPSVFSHNAIRPLELQHLSLHDFVGNYMYSSQSQSKNSLPLLNSDGYVTK